METTHKPQEETFRIHDPEEKRQHVRREAPSGQERRSGTAKTKPPRRDSSAVKKRKPEKETPPAKKQQREKLPHQRPQPKQKLP